MKTTEYITNYLKENIIESETLRRIKPVISEFVGRAPKILVTKYIDGRVHGSKAREYPATAKFVHFLGKILMNQLFIVSSTFW